jgi:hypothetical protein
MTGLDNSVANSGGLRLGVVPSRDTEVVGGERLYRTIGMVEEGDPPSTNATVLRRGTRKMRDRPARNTSPRRLPSRLHEDVEEGSGGDRRI